MLSVHSTFALIAPVFLFLLGVAQLGVWGFWRRQAPLLGQGVAFVAASMGMLVQILGWKEPFWSRVLAFSSCYVLAAAAMAVALALRLQVRTRWPWLLCLGVLLLAVQLWFALIHPSLLVRVYALSLGCMALLAVPLLQWPQMRLRNRFDNALRWVCVAMVVVNVVRTLLQLPLDPGHVYVYAVGEFIETFFWFLLYVLLMVACACAAGCLLAAVVHDELVLLASERSQDPLTQLRNRRGFAECTTRLFRRLQRRRPSGPQTCALLLCDIDHFKQINDRWGHAVGDEVLVHIAQVLQAHGSGDDVLARVGGEEFALLLPSLTRAQAQDRAQRLCDAVAAMQLAQLEGRQITVSIGVAMLACPSAQALQAAMQSADKCLYAAKRGGRNQVVDDGQLLPDMPPSAMPAVPKACLSA